MNPEEDLAPDRPPIIERWVGTFVGDAMLWPVLIVVVGHAVVALAPLMLATVRGGNISAGIALAVFGVLSLTGAIRETLRRRGVGPLGGVLLVTWVMSVAAAVAGDHYGIL